MRSPDLFVLTFILPPGARALSGHHAPSPEGCELDVEHASMIRISGPSREAVFEHSARLLRISLRDRPRVAIAACLNSPSAPGRADPWIPSGADSWEIVVNSDVTFSPSPIGVTFPRVGARGQLKLVAGGR